MCQSKDLNKTESSLSLNIFSILFFIVRFLMVLTLLPTIQYILKNVPTAVITDQSNQTPATTVIQTLPVLMLKVV